MPTGQFHSSLFRNFPAAGLAAPNDIWFATDQGLTYWADSQGNLHELLAQVPYPTVGPQGPVGNTGATGESFIGQTNYVGTWLPSPQEYSVASVVSFNGFLYLSLAALNISDNTQNPALAGGRIWQLLGPVAPVTTRTAEFIVQCDGAGLVPNLGFKGFINVPFSCTILSWVLTADQPGNASFDVKYCADSAFPATASVVGGSFPALASAQKAEGNVSTWTKTSFVEGDKLEIDLLSATTVTFLSFSLLISATN